MNILGAEAAEKRQKFIDSEIKKRKQISLAFLL
jgi:hypothetical protein